MLGGRHVVMGVTGGIAAYKACEVVSRLKKLGAEVDVIMTQNATKLVAPLTFETLSARPVSVDTFATNRILGRQAYIPGAEGRCDACGSGHRQPDGQAGLRHCG